MEMTSQKIKNKLIVSFSGEIDHHEAGAVREKLDELIFEERPENLTFDFSGVKFMDSSGIGLVLGRHRVVSSLGGKTNIIGVSASIGRIFKMSGIDKFIEVK